MIFDNIKNSEKYENINENFSKAFEFLRRNDIKTLPTGRYEIKGNEVFALIQEYETKDIKDKVYEAHKEYIDIQYMVDGEENIGFSEAGNLDIVIPYEKEKDAMFLDGEKILFRLKTGEFFVFFTGEPHLPGVINQERRVVRKVVVKIRG